MALPTRSLTIIPKSEYTTVTSEDGYEYIIPSKAVKFASKSLAAKMEAVDRTELDGVSIIGNEIDKFPAKGPIVEPWAQYVAQKSIIKGYLLNNVNNFAPLATLKPEPDHVRFTLELMVLADKLMT